MIFSSLLSTILAMPIPQVTHYQRCALNDGCTNSLAIPVISHYASTKYPIMLVHGMASSNNALIWWFGIPEDLAANGANVIVSKMSSFESSEVRGEQLLRQVEDISAIRGSPKANLIGHSHGSLSVRYVLNVKPSLVASVTTVGGPHQGSPVADIVVSASKMSPNLLTPLVATVVNAFGQLMNFISSGNPFEATYEQSSLATLNSLSSEGVTEFNHKYPIGLPTTQCGQGDATFNSTPLFSWSGTSNITTGIDVSDDFFTLTGLAFLGQANDGLIGQCSSHFGTVLRDDYLMNHFDEINMINGLVNPLGANPISVYRQQANRLKNLGL